MTEESYTWCYITKFLCRYDSLNEAKKRYQERVDAVREKYEVVLASEQAYSMGHSQPILDLLLPQAFGYGKTLTEEELEEYAVFIFTTIVTVPEDEEGDSVREAAILLELSDSYDECPELFPSRTRGIIVTPSGRESSQCIDQ